MALAVPIALAQPKPPDAGTILEQTREPIRLPPRTEPDVRPKPPEPRPALPPSPQIRVNVTKFVFSGNTIYPTEELEKVVQEFIGQQLNFEQLNDAATKVRAYHRERGYFLAQAYLPQQAIRNGTVEIAIIEGRIGILELDKRPASRLSDRLLTGILGAHLSEGDIITETGLERPLLLINDLPSASVTSEIRPSRTVGAADLRVNVDKSSDMVTGYVDFDNQGNRFTGEYRYGASLNVNNPIGFGDQFAFRGFITDEKMWYTRLSYLVPVWYYGTRIGVSYSRFDYRLEKDFKNLNANGEGVVSSIYGFHPLIRTRNSNVILQFSYEDKQLTDRIESSGTITERAIGVWKGGVVGDFRDGLLGGGLNAYALSASLGELELAPATVRANDQNPAVGGHFTQGQFQKYNLDARRLQRLTDNASLLFAFAGQKASKNLTSAEKFSLGGPNAVRAYPTSEGTGDSGFVIQAEVRYILPGFRLFNGDLSFTGFYDMGETKINEKPNPTDSPNYRTLSGYGLGVSLGREGEFLVKGMFAWRGDHEKPQSDPAHRAPRIWVQAVKWF